MVKHIGASVLALGLLLSVGAIAKPAEASSLTSTQISAIIGLLQSFGADQSVINNVSAAMGGSATSNVSCSSFANVHYGDFDNDVGGTVSQLQTFLGIPSNAFGFGTYGKKTQAAWNNRCGGSQQTTQPSATLDQNSLSQTIGGNGTAMVAITGTASAVSQLNVSIVNGSINNVDSLPIPVGNVIVSNGRWSMTSNPIYPGTYTVIVRDADVNSSYHTLTSGTLTVTSVTSSASPTCTLTSSVTSVNPGQSLTLSWTSQNAVSASWLAGDTVPTNGSEVVQITSSNTSPWYEALVVVNAAGASNKCTISIPVTPVANVPVITGVNGAGGFGTGNNNQVYGSHFTGATSVYLTNSAGAQTQLTLTVVSDTQLQVTVPNLSGDHYSLTVVNANGPSATYNAGWLGPMAKPSISSVNGAGGFGPGSNNQIIGQNFLQVNSVYLVSASGARTDLTYTVANSTQINVVVPALPSGPYTLYVGTSAGQAALAVTL